MNGDAQIIRYDAMQAGHRARQVEVQERSKPGDVSPVKGQRSGAPVRGGRKK